MFPRIASPRSCAYSLWRVRLCVTPWTGARLAPLSTGLSRQEHCSGLPCPPAGDLPNPGVEPRSPAMQVDSLPSEPPGKPLLPTPETGEVSRSCATLCDLMDCSLSGSSIHGIFQARILEWVAISFPRNYLY